MLNSVKVGMWIVFLFFVAVALPVEADNWEHWGKNWTNYVEDTDGIDISQGEHYTIQNLKNIGAPKLRDDVLYYLRSDVGDYATLYVEKRNSTNLSQLLGSVNISLSGVGLINITTHTSSLEIANNKIYVSTRFYNLSNFIGCYNKIYQIDLDLNIIGNLNVSDNTTYGLTFIALNGSVFFGTNKILYKLNESNISQIQATNSSYSFTLGPMEKNGYIFIGGQDESVTKWDQNLNLVDNISEINLDMNFPFGKDDGEFIFAPAFNYIYRINVSNLSQYTSNNYGAGGGVSGVSVDQFEDYLVTSHFGTAYLNLINKTSLAVIDSYHLGPQANAQNELITANHIYSSLTRFIGNTIILKFDKHNLSKGPVQEYVTTTSGYLGYNMIADKGYIYSFIGNNIYKLGSGLEYTSLISPDNDTTTSTALTEFECEAGDPDGLQSIALYIWNSTGQQVALVNNNVGGTWNKTTFNYPLPYYDTFTWSCRSADVVFGNEWAKENWTITYDITQFSFWYENSILRDSFSVIADTLNHTVWNDTFGELSLEDYERYDDPHLRGFWEFEEGSGTNAEDTSSYSNNATIYNLNNGVAWTSEGRFGNALEFNKTSGYLTVNSSQIVLVDNLTIEVWVKVHQGDTLYNDIVTKLDGTSSFFFLIDNQGYPYGALYGTFTGGYTQARGSVNLYDDQWHHLVWTFDGAQLKLYVDGVLSDTDTETGTITQSTDNIYIGSRQAGGHAFNGTIDNLMIWNRSFSLEEIQDIHSYRGDITSQIYSTDTLADWDQLNLVGWDGSLNENSFNLTGNNILYHFEETSGDAIDSSGNGLDGTVYNCIRNEEGKFSKAYYYDGTGDYVDIVGGTTNSISGDQTHTISMWFKPSQFGGYPMLLDACPGQPNGMNIQIGSSTVMYWRYGTNYRRYTLTTAMVIDEWQHLVCIKTGSGDNGEMYLNGVLQPTWTAWFGDMPAGAYDMQIGKYSNVGTYDYKGWIDEFAVWNRSLSATEVSQLYDFNPELNLSVRSCDDTICSGESWSELGVKSGSSELSWDLTPVNDNQYFQYRIELIGEHEYSPILNNVSIYWEPRQIDSTNFSYWINETGWPAEAVYPGSASAYFGGAYFRNLTGAVELSGGNLDGIVQSQIWDSGSLTIWEKIEFGWDGAEYNNLEDNVLLLHLNERATTSGDVIYDYSGQGNNGTANNFDATSNCSILSVFNTGCNFGTHNYAGVTVPHNTNLEINNGGSVFFWLNGTNYDTLYNTFIGKRSGGDISWQIYCEHVGALDGNSTIKIYSNTGGAVLFYDTEITEGQWQFIVMTYDDTNDIVNFYIDGEWTQQKSYNFATTNNAPLSVGFHATSPYKFHGTMDEVGITHHVLTAQEVKELYERKNTQLNYSYRACNDGFCAGDPWIDGTAWTGKEFNLTNRYFQVQFELERTSSAYSVRVFNFSVEFDRQDTWVNIEYPQPITYNDFVTCLNYSYSNLDWCWWSNNSGVWNSTPIATPNNFSGLTSNEGSNTWTIYCNNSIGETAKDNVTFIVDTTPFIFYVPPTPTHLSVLSNGTNVCQNVSLAETYFNNVTFRLYDITGVLFIDTYTDATRIKCYNLGDGDYWINATTCTTSGKCNTTETRQFTINTAGPIFSNFSIEDLHTNQSGPWTLNWSYNVSDPILDSCWYRTDENSTNVSITCNAGPYFTIFNNAGHHNITYCANNTLGQVNCQVGHVTIYYFNWTQSDNPDPSADGVLTVYTLVLSLEDIELNWPDSNVTFHWANSTYPNPTKVMGTDIITYTQNIIIPQGTGSSTGTVISWYWDYEIKNSTTEYQDAFNLSYATNRTTTETTTVYNLNINDCIIGNGTMILNYSLFDEETRTPPRFNETNATINGTIEIHVIVKSAFNKSIIWEYHTYRRNFTYYGGIPIAQVCVDSVLLNATPTNYTYFLMDVVTRYDYTDHVYEYNYFDEVKLNASSVWHVKLHDLETEDSTSFLVTYKNEYYLPEEDCVVDLWRYYVGDGEYISVEHGRTDVYGQTRLHMVTEDVRYRTIVRCLQEETGEWGLEYTSPEFLALCQQTPCTISLQKEGTVEEVGNYTTIENLIYSVDLDRPTRTVTLTYATVDGSPVTMNLSLTRLDAYLNETICENTQTSSGGSIVCIVPANPSPNTTYVVDVEMADSRILRTYFDLTPHPDEIFGKTGIILTVLLFMTLVLMGVGSGVTVVIFGIVGLIFASILTIFAGGNVIGLGSSILWLIVAGIILLVKMANRKGGG